MAADNGAFISMFSQPRSQQRLKSPQAQNRLAVSPPSCCLSFAVVVASVPVGDLTAVFAQDRSAGQPAAPGSLYGSVCRNKGRISAV